MWWGNHGETIAKDADVANYVWLSDIIKDGVPTYGAGGDYERAYIREDDIITWGAKCKDIQRDSNTRYWHRGGDWKELQEAVKKDGFSLAKMPWNIVWADLLNEDDYLKFADTLINKVQGQCDFEELGRINWTPWACQYPYGSPRSIRLTPYPVCGLQVRELGGNLINLRLGFRDPEGNERWSEWLTSNFEGKECPAVWLTQGDKAVGIAVRLRRELNWDCLVNAQLISSTGNSSGWAYTKMEGEEHALKLPSGNFIGAQVREDEKYTRADLRSGRSHHVLVDVRLVYRS